ncbi:hypothetical protein E2C01_079297 [Portunus trituberculatus]|uniref:Uncharacterized protein n=1 Tax=Portunus trituberculatus TaxID=210409 RepID=A0A5B7ISZ1_PORTR|nr:hypothetical protein [Portunus trituberculatus]
MHGEVWVSNNEINKRNQHQAPHHRMTDHSTKKRVVDVPCVLCKPCNLPDAPTPILFLDTDSLTPA